MRRQRTGCRVGNPCECRRVFRKPVISESVSGAVGEETLATFEPLLKVCVEERGIPYDIIPGSVDGNVEVIWNN